MLTSDYVGPAPGGNVVYVIVGDRAKFDQIARPMTDHSTGPAGMRVLSKTIGNQSVSSEDGLVIFQYWFDGSDSKREAA